MGRLKQAEITKQDSLGLRALQPRYIGALRGAAVGEAFGLPHAFKSRAEMQQEPALKMDEYGTYGMRRGTWSEQTALTFASAAVCAGHAAKGFPEYSDPELAQDLTRVFLRWWQAGDFTVHGKVFAFSQTTASVLKDYLATDPDNRTCLQGLAEATDASGLVRLLPLALAGHRFAVNPALVEQMVSLTHRHPLVISAAQHYVRVFHYLTRCDFKTAIAQATEDTATGEGHFAPDLNALYEKPLEALLANAQADNSTGESAVPIDRLLETAYACIARSDSFESALILAVNLGGSTDILGAVVGSLAGFIHGPKAIPKDWWGLMERKSKLRALFDHYADALLRKGLMADFSHIDHLQDYLQETTQTIHRSMRALRVIAQYKQASPYETTASMEASIQAQCDFLERLETVITARCGDLLFPLPEEAYRSATQYGTAFVMFDFHQERRYFNYFRALCNVSNDSDLLAELREYTHGVHYVVRQMQTAMAFMQEYMKQARALL